jgi:hypothetical protein
MGDAIDAAFSDFEHEEKHPYGDAIDMAFQETGADEEPWWKNVARTALQIPKGMLQGTKYGMITGLMNMIGTGEALDPEEIEHIKMISEREGVPFDEQKYMEAVQGASEAFPTVENISRGIEHATGIPLEANTWLQKIVNFASMATQAIKPGDWIKPANYAGTGFRGTDVALPYPVVGTGVAVAKEGLEAAGVPEQLAELGSFAVTKQMSKGSAQLQIGKKTKPSGLPERGFEDLKSTRKVSEAKIAKLNEKLETDFKTISDQIIKESPIGETAKELANNPAFKEESRTLLNEAKSIAESTQEPFAIADLKKDLADTTAKNMKGLITSEYEDAYSGYMNGFIRKFKDKEGSALSLYEQYRKNNESLGEYFAPGSSKSVNRAHKDALLDFNRSIAKTMEKSYPDSPLVPVFKEGNARWSKIMDAEMVDKFVGELFKDGVDFQKMNKFLESKGYAQSFKRALGEDGYKAFRSVVNDMAFSKTAYNKMKVMRGKSGLEVTAETMLPYFINPKLGAAATGKKLVQGAYRSLINYMLDKPKFTIRWKKAIDTLKEGKMSQAAKQFEALHGELLEAERSSKPIEAGFGEEIKASRIKPKEIEGTREVKTEAKGITHQPKEIGGKGTIQPIKPNPSDGKIKSFTTEKGSTYTINEDGTTTRTKAFRPEHGAKEQGLQPRSDKTYYVTPDQANQLAEIQTQGAGNKRLFEYPDGKVGVLYTSGKNQGKVSRESLVQPQKTPKEGLIPVELWENGERVHFGNKIKEIEAKTPVKESAREKVAPRQIEHKKPEAKVEKVKPVRQKASPKKETKPHLKPETLKMQKKYILDKVEDAIKSPTDASKLTIDVPDDGKFVINNKPEVLKKFETKVKRNWPTERKSEAPYPKHESLSNKLPEPEIKDYEIKTRSGEVETAYGEVYNDLYAIRKSGNTYNIQHIPSGTNIIHLDSPIKAKKFLAQMYAKKYGKEAFYSAENMKELEALLDMKELEKIHKSLNKS